MQYLKLKDQWKFMQISSITVFDKDELKKTLKTSWKPGTTLEKKNELFQNLPQEFGIKGFEVKHFHLLNNHNSLTDLETFSLNDLKNNNQLLEQIENIAKHIIPANAGAKNFLVNISLAKDNLETYHNNIEEYFYGFSPQNTGYIAYCEVYTGDPYNERKGFLTRDNNGTYYTPFINNAFVFPDKEMIEEFKHDMLQNHIPFRMNIFEHQAHYKVCEGQELLSGIQTISSIIEHQHINQDIQGKHLSDTKSIRKNKL